MEKEVYIIESCESLNDLIDWVNLHIKKGYVPIGNIVRLWDEEYKSERFIQSMILKEYQ